MDCSLPGFSAHTVSPDKNTRVGSLSLLQGSFLTQELNWGLLHCRRILYQLSYQRIPPSLWYTPAMASFSKSDDISLPSTKTLPSHLKPNPKFS